jgi:hypothetical protein
MEIISAITPILHGAMLETVVLSGRAGILARERDQFSLGRLVAFARLRHEHRAAGIPVVPVFVPALAPDGGKFFGL